MIGVLSIAAILLIGVVTDDTVAAGAVTKAQVKAKALSVSDLPTGWSVDNTKHTTIGGCLTPVFRDAHIITAKVQFSNGGDLPALQEEVATSKSPTKTYSAAVKRLNACHFVSESIQGHPITAKIGQLSYPHVGNQSSAYNVSFSAAGISVSEDFVVLRAGAYIAAILLGDVGTADTKLLEGFVTEAVNKIEGKPTTPPTTS